jgi:hypothetical protein
LLATFAMDKTDKKSGVGRGCLKSSEISIMCSHQCCFLGATPPLVLSSATYPAHQSLPLTPQQKDPENSLEHHTN